jgi:putative oxygen-independent coproporphyrinogen III oxidase
LSASPLADIGVYIHWPYCARICPYCDFNVVRERGREAEKAALVDAIVADLTGYARLTGPRRLVSIFFGGGTPSLMAPEAIARIIDATRTLWTPADDIEISLEANPTDAESARFADIGRTGVRRLSLGVQSFDDQELAFLGRNHDALAARKAIDLAMAAFPRVSIDLIYALPGQSIGVWRERLGCAIATGCEHISAYQLSIEPGAAFSRAVRRGALRPTSDDLAAELFDVTQDTLTSAGYDAYEVSNHARGEAARSRHNLIYWRGGDYIGVGPGAHGRLTLDGPRVATEARAGIADYLATVRESGSGATSKRMDCQDVALERLVMGLRTDEGVARQDLRDLGISTEKLDDLAEFVAVDQDRLIATPRGRLVLDRVLAELVADSVDD